MKRILHTLNIKPLVSVIIPVFNRPKEVEEALLSVFKQTYSHYEVIVGDDGSTDDTASIVSQCFLQAPEGVKTSLLKLNHSGFPGQVRNLCADQARGELLAFLDSDDLWMAEKLEKQVDLFIKDKKTVICHTREVWNRQGKIISQSKLRHKRSGDIFLDSLVKCIIGPSTTMIKGTLFNQIGGFDPYIEVAEDYELWLRVCNLHKVAYIDIPLIEKRAGHGAQLSEKYGQIEIFRIKALKQLVDRQIFTPPHQVEARAELSRKCFVYSKGARKRGREHEANQYEAMSQKYLDCI